MTEPIPLVAAKQNPRSASRRWLVVIPPLLVVLLPLVWFFFWPAPDPGEILSVECDYSPGYSYSYWWKIKIDATGHGTYSLGGFQYKKQESEPISVPIAELQQAIRDNALATLPSKRSNRYIPDSSWATMHIKTTKLEKTIHLHWDDRGIFDLYSRRADNLFFTINRWMKPHAIRLHITPVKGRLIINGQPAKSRIRVTVREPDAPPEDTGKHAFTDANGDFEFMSVQRGDGLMPGTYDNTILWGHTDTEKHRYLGPDRLGNRYNQEHPWKKGLVVEDDKPTDLGTIDIKIDLPADLKDNDIDRFPDKTNPPQNSSNPKP